MSDSVNDSVKYQVLATSIPPSTRKRILKLVEEGKYETIADFLRQAIDLQLREIDEKKAVPIGGERVDG